MESIGHIQDGSLVREAQVATRPLSRNWYRPTIKPFYGSLCGSLGRRACSGNPQEAFLKVYKKLDGFRFECSFATWIYRIVTNVCLDHLRRNQVRG